MQVLQGSDGIPATTQLPRIEEAALWELELREGSIIERTDRIPCTIALGQVPFLSPISPPSAAVPCSRMTTQLCPKPPFYTHETAGWSLQRKYKLCDLSEGDPSL